MMYVAKQYIKNEYKFTIHINNHIHVVMIGLKLIGVLLAVVTIVAVLQGFMIYYMVHPVRCSQCDLQIRHNADWSQTAQMAAMSVK